MYTPVLSQALMSKLRCQIDFQVVKAALQGGRISAGSCGEKLSLGFGLIDSLLKVRFYGSWIINQIQWKRDVDAINKAARILNAMQNDGRVFDFKAIKDVAGGGHFGRPVLGEEIVVPSDECQFAIALENSGQPQAQLSIGCFLQCQQPRRGLGEFHSTNKES